MKKFLTVAILIVLGIIAGTALILGAVIDLIEGIISMIFWTVVVLVGYFFIKKKVS